MALVVLLVAIFILAALVFLLSVIAWMVFRAKGVKALRITYENDRDMVDTNRGWRYLIRVTSEASVPVSDVRVQIEQIKSDPAGSRERQNRANHANLRFLTIRDGEPVKPSDGDNAREKCSLTAGQSEMWMVATVYRDGQQFVLSSLGHWSREGTKWDRINARLESGGFYKMKVRAFSDDGFYGEAEFRFGIKMGEIQNNPTFEQIS